MTDAANNTDLCLNKQPVMSLTFCTICFQQRDAYLTDRIQSGKTYPSFHVWTAYCFIV